MSPYFLLGQYKTLYDKVNQTLDVLPTLDYRHPLFPLPIGHFVNCMAWWGHAYTGDYDPKVHLETQVHLFISSTNIYQSNLDSFFVLMPVCFMYFYQGVLKQAVNYLSRTLAYAIELEIDLYIPSLSAALSCTYSRLNQKEEGKKYLDRALTAFYSNDSCIPKMLSLDLITEALLLLGDYSAAQTFCQKSLQIAENSQLAGIKATLLRLNAQITLNLPEPNYSLIRKQLILSMKSGEKLGMLLNTAHCQYLFTQMYQQMGDRQASKQAKKTASNSYMKLGFRQTRARP
jgi:tetratricopeptide (TPR) repeat protein